MLKIVDAPPSDEGKVHFGALVTLEDEAGERVSYTLVGSDETEPTQRRISMESPLARALLGKRVDDEVLVERPRGDATYVIVEIRYPRAE